MCPRIAALLAASRLPEDVGLSSERLRRLQSWSDGWVDSGKFPGLFTLIARRGKLCFAHASGVADVETGAPMAMDTIVRLYSLSKPLVSVCAMVLYERGFFQLDEPISHHLPSFSNPTVLLPSGETVPAQREITVRDLLTHTAGLTYGDSDSGVDSLYKAAGCGWDSDCAFFFHVVAVGSRCWIRIATALREMLHSGSWVVGRRLGGSYGGPVGQY